MNQTNNGEKYGVLQYAHPHAYELAGRTLTFADGQGSAYTLAFTDTHTVRFTAPGVNELSQYEAEKLDESTYLVAFGLVFRAAVIDTASGCAAFTGEAKGEYVLCRTAEAAEQKFALTDEMTGTYVRWVYGCDRSIVNEHIGGGKCRCAWSPRQEIVRTVPVTEIRLKDSFYLVELNSSFPRGVDFPSSYTRNLMVQNYDKMEFVGCMYSPTTNQTLMTGGYGLDPATQKI